jgi:hypothetical protein
MRDREERTPDSGFCLTAPAYDKWMVTRRAEIAACLGATAARLQRAASSSKNAVICLSDSMMWHDFYRSATSCDSVLFNSSRSLTFCTVVSHNPKLLSEREV